MFLTGKETLNQKKEAIGGKAYNLSEISKLKLNIPGWVVIPISDILRPSEIDKIDEILGSPLYFSVRSSADAEDGEGNSFAGLFESFLFVKKENLYETYQKVLESSQSGRVKVYCKARGIKKEPKMAVIIQKMLHADVSGVMFGQENGRIISACYGAGEGLVNGDLNADNFFIKNDKIEKQIADKTHAYLLNTNEKLEKTAVDSAHIRKSCLSDQTLFRLNQTASLIEKHYGQKQDIEFCVGEDEIFILQSRPVTSEVLSASQSLEPETIWDNSNIIESYPGITLPLTFSFIEKMYESVYRQFAGLMGVPLKTVNQHDQVFADMLGHLNGRVYYNLTNWYGSLSLLPGYQLNARAMEKMMGVKDPLDIPPLPQPGKLSAKFNLIRSLIKIVTRWVRLKKDREKFVAFFNQTLNKHKSYSLGDKNLNELLEIYHDFSRVLLKEWKAPLINDFFAMIFFGLFQKTGKKYQMEDGLINDLLIGTGEMISSKPATELLKIIENINARGEKEKYLQLPPDVFWNENKHIENHESLNEIKAYIQLYGDRCVGELKLENQTYKDEPWRLIGVIQSYLKSDSTPIQKRGNTALQRRLTAEKEAFKYLVGSPLKKGYFRFLLNQTRDLLTGRENLRFERTRGFGFVRSILNEAGKRLKEKNSIESEADIFFLSLSEIDAFIRGKSPHADLKMLVQNRKSEYDKFGKADNMPERIATRGVPYPYLVFNVKKSGEKLQVLKGLPCCGGIVTAKVRVLSNPNEIASLNGDILVTSSTDPGWITLFPSASGILVERGSLLSHSAIVSREMGIPCIVAVKGLLESLKTGDKIMMNAQTGMIELLEPSN